MDEGALAGTSMATLPNDVVVSATPGAGGMLYGKWAGQRQSHSITIQCI